MSESHIIIDIPESSLTDGQLTLQQQIKNQFDVIQNDIKPGASSYSNSTWFFFFLKYGKSLLSTPIISQIQNVTQFFKDALSINSSGGGYTVGLNFFKDCLSNNDSKDIAGIKFRRVIRNLHPTVDGQWQLITYGAPGTGKSFQTKLETDGKTVYRTTFHPDSDYSTFVGAYKPTMSDDAGRIEVYKGSGGSRVLDATQEIKKGIAYDFVPQAFIKAYVDAWTKMNAGGNPPEPVFLVIEEINRGNCAQIFGDLFQLLDRRDDGYSDYPIEADADLQRFLKGQLGTFANIPAEVSSGTKLILPPNLFIRATMNTSDQSLFPIDSAFKRRWDWKYIPISKPDKSGDGNWKERKILVNSKKYDWWEFLKTINYWISKKTSSEDKQLGYFFVKADDSDGIIHADVFVNKVLFYLYNDVFKDYDLPKEVFGRSGSSEKFMFKDFFHMEADHDHKVGDVNGNELDAFLAHLNFDQNPEQVSTSDESPAAPSL